MRCQLRCWWTWWFCMLGGMERKTAICLPHMQKVTCDLGVCVYPNVYLASVQCHLCKDGCTKSHGLLSSTTLNSHFHPPRNGPTLPENSRQGTDLPACSAGPTQLPASAQQFLRWSKCALWHVHDRAGMTQVACIGPRVFWMTLFV